MIAGRAVRVFVGNKHVLVYDVGGRDVRRQDVQRRYGRRLITPDCHSRRHGRRPPARASLSPYFTVNVHVPAPDPSRVSARSRPTAVAHLFFIFFSRITSHGCVCRFRDRSQTEGRSPAGGSAVRTSAGARNRYTCSGRVTRGTRDARITHTGHVTAASVAADGEIDGGVVSSKTRHAGPLACN